MHPLYIGIADFERPTLLIAGDSDALFWFANQIESRQPFRAERFPQEVKLVHVKLHLNPVDSLGKLERHNNLFDWKVAAIDANSFSEKLKTLSRNPSPAHAYLDTPSDLGIDIVASKGEYKLPDVYA